MDSKKNTFHDSSKGLEDILTTKNPSGTSLKESTGQKRSHRIFMSFYGTINLEWWQIEKTLHAGMIQLLNEHGIRWEERTQHRYFNPKDTDRTVSHIFWDISLKLSSEKEKANGQKS